MIKTFGCSYTKYRWNTWPNFLHLSANGMLKNYGVSGSSNEIICRNICKNADNDDTVLVMWSGFDRTHSDVFYKKNNYNEGRYHPTKRNQEYLLSLEQLYDRSIEYIWLANRFCEEKNIKIYNFNMTILEMGETKELQKFTPYLPIGHETWPIDMDSFCLKNPPIGKTIEDNHPSPSQHYKYHKQIICPKMNIEPFEISDQNLKNLDDKRSL